MSEDKKGKKERKKEEKRMHSFLACVHTSGGNSRCFSFFLKDGEMELLSMS
jgi:hypothetical protein